MGIETKKIFIKKQITENHKCSGTSCQRCVKIFRLIDLMEESNIPVGYWLLTMKDFSGSEKLKNIVDDFISNIKQKYISGKSICFSGSHGIGKTLSSICILKSAIKNNFSCYYITANDILSGMTSVNNSLLREKLKNTDFLVIDELDSRFFQSDNTKSLFSGIYENIFRFRTHNMLPTIICTNETGGILNVFHGPVINSIESLNKQYLTIYPIAGTDFRKRTI